MPSLAKEIARPDPRIFRRAYIKRRSATTGLYESSWLPITQYVERWGEIGQSIDDVRLNRFKNDGSVLSVRNDEGKFNHHSNSSSLWFGYMGRYRTLVKIEAGYTSDAGTEYPTDPTVGIFLMNDEVPTSAERDVCMLRGSSLQAVFDEVRARELPGLTATMTASDFVARVRDHTDGSGNFIFRQFITTTAWSIDTTTNPHLLNTDTALEDKSVWQIIEKLAEAELKVPLINRTGGFEFRSRSERTTTSAFTFYGQGFPLPNVISLQSEKESLDKNYTVFRLKHVEGETTTAYVQAGTTTTVSPSSVPWQTGQRLYEFENLFVANTATAQSIVDAMLAEFQTVKKEYEFHALNVPSLELLDKVLLNYVSYDLANSPLWDASNWDDFDWAQEGENFALEDKAVKILSKRLNLDDFTVRIRAREI